MSIDATVSKYLNEQKRLDEMIVYPEGIPRLIQVLGIETEAIYVCVTFIVFLLVILAEDAFPWIPVWIKNHLIDIAEKTKRKLPTSFNKIMDVLEADPEWPKMKRKMLKMTPEPLAEFLHNYLEEKGLTPELKEINKVVKEFWESTE